MPRKRVTQLFPWLLPLRTKQRLFCFYAGMRLDGSYYARTKSAARLPCLLFETRCPLYNRDTGFDLKYQENKVFNLKLAAATLDGVVIRSGETFSFWTLVRHADRRTPYRDGLTVVDGKLTTVSGGGMCQMSNLLFWLFLHAPLTVVERHGHPVKDFPEPPSDAPSGVDATVSEGWLDLKVKNATDAAYQIGVAFDAGHIIGRLYTDKDTGCRCEVSAGDPLYYRRGGRIYEETDIRQRTVSRQDGAYVSEKLLYRNSCEIGYPLPNGTRITEWENIHKE